MKLRRLMTVALCLGITQLGLAHPTEAAPLPPRPKPIPAAAPPRPPPPRPPAARGHISRSEKVQVRVMVVFATDSHNNIDERLGSLVRSLSHLRYSGYELLDTVTLSLGNRGVDSFTIVGGRRVTVELLSKDERRVRMRVQIHSESGGKLLDTTLSCNRNGTVIFAGPRHKDGILVLPLTPRY